MLHFNNAHTYDKLNNTKQDAPLLTLGQLPDNTYQPETFHMKHSKLSNSAISISTW